MRLTAVYEPAAEGGYTCWVEEIPAAISEGDTLEEAEANLQEALALVLECQHETDRGGEGSLAGGRLRDWWILATAVGRRINGEQRGVSGGSVGAEAGCVFLPGV